MYNKKLYYSPANLDGYDEIAKETLTSELESSGFKYKPGERGGGPEETIKQVVADLSVNGFWIGILSNLATSVITKVLTKLWKWNKKHQKKDNFVPVVVVYYYRGIFKKQSSRIEFRIDEKPDRKNVKEKLNNKN